MRAHEWHQALIGSLDIVPVGRQFIFGHETQGAFEIVQITFEQARFLEESPRGKRNPGKRERSDTRHGTYQLHWDTFSSHTVENPIGTLNAS